MPKKSKEPKSIDAIKCANNLKIILKYRDMTLADLADDLNMKLRTLESYSSAEVSLEDARARTVMEIAEYLDVDPYILVGMKPVDDFFEAARNREEMAKRVLMVEPWRRKRRRSTTYLDSETGETEENT